MSNIASDGPVAHLVEPMRARETDRVLRVLDGRLATSPYLAADQHGAADVMTWPWINAAASKLGVTLDPYPSFVRWRDDVASRPAVQRGLLVPDLAETRGRRLNAAFDQTFST
jgi:glutathione S-transferase